MSVEGQLRNNGLVGRQSLWMGLLRHRCRQDLHRRGVALRSPSGADTGALRHQPLPAPAAAVTFIPQSTWDELQPGLALQEADVKPQAQSQPLLVLFLVLLDSLVVE